MKKPISVLFAVLCHLILKAQFTDSLKNNVSFQYDYQHTSQQGIADWHIGGITYSRKTTSGTFLGRVSYANRFNRNGWQGEAEAYPQVSKRIYLYTGIGYSNNVPVFPSWKAGISLYLNFPKGWEAEGGTRYLFFDKDIYLAVAGLSKYAGSWLMNLRSFVTINEQFRDPSIFASVRRYFKNEKDYIWLQLGSGISPDETRNVQISQAALLSSKNINIGIRRSVMTKTAIVISGGWIKEENPVKNYNDRITGTIELKQYF